MAERAQVERLETSLGAIEFDPQTGEWFEVAAVRRVISARRAVRMLAVAGLVLPALHVAPAHAAYSVDG